MVIVLKQKTVDELLHGKKNTGNINSNKVVIDGIKFDSEMEGEHYRWLKSKKEAGEIISFDCHVREIVFPPGKKIKSYKYWDGGKERSSKNIEYFPDFVVKTKDGWIEYHEVKGKKTRDWEQKWKMLKYKYRNEKNIRYELVDSKEWYQNKMLRGRYEK